MLSVVLLAGMAAGAAGGPAARDLVRCELLKNIDRVELDGTLVRTQEVRIQLLTAEGVEKYRELNAGYVDGYGDVAFEDVVVVKADGRRVALNEQPEDVNPFSATNTRIPADAAVDIRLRKMTLPGLEPGDRLSYRIVGRHRPFAGERACGLVKLMPVMGSPLQTYELDLPRNADIKVRLRKGLGIDWKEVPSAPDRLVRRLSARITLPSATATPAKERLASGAEPDVIFTSFSTWADLAGWWWSISKDRLSPDESVAKEAARLTASAVTPRQKLAALHAFVTRIPYVAVALGLGRVQPRNAATVLANGYGDCKDKHSLLATLAQGVGIDVRPVLISSKWADLYDDVPSLQFDHMISVARLGGGPGDWLWLDGTASFSPVGYLAPSLRGKRALVIEADGGAVLARTPKDPPFETRLEVTVKATLDAEGKLFGRCTWQLRSDQEPALRAWFAAASEEQKRHYVATRFPAWRGIDKVSVSDPLAVSSPLRVEFDALREMEGKTGERRLRVPFPEVSLPEPVANPPAGSPIVTFGRGESVQRAEVEIPWWQQARPPKSVTLRTSFGTFRSVYVVEGRRLKLERTLSLSGSSISATDAASYREFRKAVLADQEQAFTVKGKQSARSVAAERLREQGADAIHKEDDDAKGERLLKQATKLDPNVEGDFFYLGRALQDLDERGAEPGQR